MNQFDNPDNESASSSGSLSLKRLLLIVLLAVVVVVALFQIRERRRLSPDTSVPERIAVAPEGSRAVTLYFAHEQSQTLVTETRLVAIGMEYVEQIEQVLSALVSGPEVSGVSTIPQGTRLLNVFYDSDAATLYLDFSSELVAGHPGGSSAEYYTVAAVMRTVSENFPEVTAVQFLIEGFQVGTIAGHIDAHGPFLVSDWR